MSRAQTARERVDVAMCFVPQWTPFQPPLALPSLAAWVRRAGFSASLLDANAGFYDFLLGGRCASILLEQDLPEPRNRIGREKRRAARDAVSEWAKARERIGRIRRWQDLPHETVRTMRDAVLGDTQDSVRAFETYLGHVTALSPRFSVTPYGFKAELATASAADIERFVEDPPELLRVYADQIATEILEASPRWIGLSCVGFTQLIFTLLVGRSVKRQSETPVVVGGSIFPRIIEREALPTAWLGRYVDVIVRDEGEKPLEALLRLHGLDPIELRTIPGLVFAEDGDIFSTAAAPLLKPAEVPPPDFTGMPLASYFTSTVTFPIIASRGCYWGKCEFCHVAVEKYSGYKPNDVIATIDILREKHGARLFFFHDYAIPPAIFRRLGREMPRDAGIYMAALFKFEKYFETEDFTHAYDVGFRLLQVGLESASERVLALMRKNSTQPIMLANLGDGAAAGIWMHCFVLFGFPGETDAEARETVDFMLRHRDIVGSFEAGRFELEHSAPMMKRLGQHGVTAIPRGRGDVSVYYEHEIADGIDGHGAMLHLRELYERALLDRRYGAIGWIPQQSLFVLLSLFAPDELVEGCIALQDREPPVNSDLRPAASLSAAWAPG